MTNVHPRYPYIHPVRGRGRGNFLEQGVHSVPGWNVYRQDNRVNFRTVVQPSIDVKVNNECEIVKNESEDILNNGENVDSNQFTSNCSQSSETCGKKKTPMCLVNELARHHKLQPQYRLTDESGPAHQKTFTVNLKLGDEEYTASGPSIKKAQHAAAQEALTRTNYPQPQPKPKVRSQPTVQGEKSVTPTVELNALAMKLNLPPVYTTLVPTPHSQPHNYNSNTKFNGTPIGRGVFRNFHSPIASPVGQYLNTDFQPRHPMSSSRVPSYPNQRYYCNRVQPTPVIHRVSLTVGEVNVIGEGPNPQAARHHAAKQALEQLKLRDNISNCETDHSIPVIANPDPEADSKSPVSLVHELALKLNQNVEFSVVTESGPPHMKNFVIECKLAEFTTCGEGNCKKLAKKKAAELMLAELKKAYPNGITGTTEPMVVQRIRSKSKPVTARKKPRNLVKETCSNNNGSGGRPQDPISRLVQLQQARKEKEPTFTVVSERGIPRQPEFVVQVSVGSFTAVGVGSKKKEAKRAAAQKALEMLGVGSSEACKDVSSIPEPDSKTNSGRQQSIPGLLVMGGNKTRNSEVSSFPVLSISSDSVTGTSQPKSSSGGLCSENRLRYLAQILSCEVDFADFPKSKTGEYLSLVTLTTTPTKVSHGTGPTVEEAHESAAANMLKLLADGGLDAVTTKQDASEHDKKH